MKTKEIACILEKEIQGPYLKLVLESPQIARLAQPGQFVNVRVHENLDPLLRRPFSIADADAVAGRLTLLVLVRGKGSKLLASKNEGDTVNLIGPLGNAFPEISKNPLFVAGGIGIAPFLFLSRKYPGATLIFGVREASLAPDLAPFRERLNLELASDDGSLGEKGTVIDLLSKHDLQNHTTFACGPTPMFRAMNKLFSACPRVDAYYSLETYMGCGFGVCKGCVVETTDGGHKLCCTDGPVFAWDQVKL